MTLTTTTLSPIDPKRMGRACEIWTAGHITSIDGVTWHVASQSGTGYHLVTKNGPEGLADLSCTCADWMKRNYPEIGLQASCKHCLAVALDEGLIDAPPGAVDEPDSEEEDVAVEWAEVTTRLQADGALWQLSQLEDERREIESLAQHEIEHIQRWQEQETARLAQRIQLFSSSLEAFLKREGHKSLRLPHGELKLRKAPDTLQIDEETFDWTQEAFVRIVPEQRKPDVAKLKKHLKATGELLPGVQWQPGTARFSFVATSSRKEDLPTTPK